jgi:DNA-binding XRE family transcriptional regulator
MPGSWITQQQVKIYMTSRQKGHTQATAAAKAGISERSGRDLEQGQWVDPRTKLRHWRTRKDPLAAVWEAELVPLLEQTSDLQAITLLEYLAMRVCIPTRCYVLCNDVLSSGKPCKGLIKKSCSGKRM